MRKKFVWFCQIWLYLRVKLINNTSPPDEPPELWRVSYGFSVRPVTKLCDSQLVQNSGVFDTSNGIPPADLSNATVSPSSVAFIPFLCTEPTENDIPVWKQTKKKISSKLMYKIFVVRNIFWVNFLVEKKSHGHQEH